MAVIKIAIVVSLVTLVHGAPNLTPESQQNGEKPNVVPGVFISADTLKDLQSRTQQNLSGEENLNRNQISEGATPPILQEVTPNSLMVQGNQQSLSNQPVQYPQQQQPILATQGQAYQQQPQYVNQQPQYVNQQPQYLQPQYQQPQYQQPQYQQPQYQQPQSYQPQMVNGPLQSFNGQQQPIYSNQPQYPVGQQAGLPNQQQPIYQRPMNNQPTLVYPNAQLPTNQPTMVYQNGPSLVPQNQVPIVNQPTLIYPTNQVPNQQVITPSQPGNLYTLVPVNNVQSTVPNPNLGGGSYLVQQSPSPGPIYLNNGK